MFHAKTPALGENENPERQRRHNHIHPEEAADLVGKQLVPEARKIESVLHNPGKKQRIWEKHA